MDPCWIIQEPMSLHVCQPLYICVYMYDLQTLFPQHMLGEQGVLTTNYRIYSNALSNDIYSCVCITTLV